MRLAVEVQREVVRGEDLAERHRCRVLGIGDDKPVVDAQTCQLACDELPERIAAYAGDQCCSPAEACSRHRDVCCAAAEKLAEGLDVFESDTGLKWVDVHPRSADGKHVEWCVRDV